jgi:metal-responsive CopG/Arc/MetJ family transcriptional regulator
MARFCLRISDEIMEQIHWAVAERGLQSPSALIRQAISNELRQDVSALTEAEE